MTDPIKIVLVDDHELFLEGIKRLLQKQSDITIIGSYNDGKSLLRDLKELEVDLLLLDLQLPDMQAEELLKQIIVIRPALPILYLTMMRGARIFRRLENYPIGGYILKDTSLENLCAAIRKVSKGDKHISEDIYLSKDLNLNTVTTPKERLAELLSPREKEVLALICQEYSSAEIAKQLYISTSTVDTHRKKMLLKLGVQNTVGLVKFALKNGIVND